MHMSPALAMALDRLIGEVLALGSDLHGQVWFYLQVERGSVRQFGTAPLPGLSVRFRDSGRG